MTKLRQGQKSKSGSSSSLETVVVSRGRRPILSAGIALIAAMIFAIVVLAPTIAARVGFYQGDARTNSPFAYSALAIILFCAPALTGIVIVILKNLFLPRKRRYLLAGLAVLITVPLFWLACFTCMVPYGTRDGRLMLMLLTTALLWFGWLIVLAGLLFGVSLPTTAKMHADTARPAHPLRTKIIAMLILLAWLALSYTIIATVLSKVWLVTFFNTPILALDEALCHPMAAFCISAVFSALLWRSTTIELKRSLERALFIIPLILFGGMLALALVDALLTQALATLDFVTTAASGLFVLAGCLDGIVFGIGIGRLQK